MTDRLYVDNAATSFPKPPEVMAAMTEYAEGLGASAGRGAYREAMQTGERLRECRERLARLIHAPDVRQIVFGLNCSEALNLAMRGLLDAGDHVVTTRFEHNSVLRPLHDLAQRAGVEATFVEADRSTGLVDPDAVRRAMRRNTRLVVLQHASNVTGTIQPIDEVGRIASEHDVLLLVDAAQSAGHLPIDVVAQRIDLLAFPGHKGLLGPLGTGGLYIRLGVESRLRPLVAGGTGSVSEQPTQPTHLPDKYESGSHNAIGLAGLSAAAEWLLRRGVSAIAQHGRELSRRFLERASAVEGVTLFGPRDPRERVPVFSLRVDGMEPAEAAAVLEAEFGILCRAGIHCAPWAHETLGTAAEGGTVRLSFGVFNTLADVDRCVEALSRVAHSVARTG